MAGTSDVKEPRQLRAGESAFIWLLMAFSIFVLIMAYRISGFSSISSPGAFPLFGSAVMVVSLVMVLMEHRKLKKPDAEHLSDELSEAVREVFPLRLVGYVGIIVLYMVLMEPFHFLPSSFAFLVVSMIILHGGGFIKSLLISAGTLICIYIVFQFFFRVVMP